jgi:hypothetical protein
MKEYFHGGATWTVAPKPLMDDALYDKVIRMFIKSRSNHSKIATVGWVGWLKGRTQFNS